MVLTEQTLEDRIRNLQTQREQALAVLHGCAGAIQVLQELLVDLKKPETPPEK